MPYKRNVDGTARRQMRKLVGPEPSPWDEVIAAYAKSEHLRLPELLDIVVDVTRAVHGLSYDPIVHEQQIVVRVLEQLAQVERRAP